MRQRPELRMLADNASAMTLGLGVAHYLDRLRARGKAANTLLAYGSDLRQFVEFCAGLGQGDLVALVTQRHVSRWLDDLDARDVTPRSQARKLTVLRSFMKHAQREGWIGHDPTADERVAFRKKRVIAPEMDQLHAMVDAIGRVQPLDLRDRALLRLALDTGLRISEVAALDIPGSGSQSTIDLKRLLVHAVSKGGDVETVAFNDRTARIVEDWLRVRGDLANPGEVALFVTTRGGRPCRAALHEVIRKRGAAAGIEGLHFHLLRHRRGSQVIEACGDKVGQQFLRHSSLETTSDYGRHANNRTHALIRERADVDHGRAVA